MAPPVPLFRFSLRTLLIACALGGPLCAFGWRFFWAKGVHSTSGKVPIEGAAADEYAEVLLVSRYDSLMRVVVIPRRISSRPPFAEAEPPASPGFTMKGTRLFFGNAEYGPKYWYSIWVVEGEQVHEIPLTWADRNARNLEQLAHTKTWKDHVVPVIQEVRARHRASQDRS